jgi:transcriptional regulator with XRE-family HTH domain
MLVHRNKTRPSSRVQKDPFEIDVMKAVGANLSEVRTQKGFQAADFAALLGVAERTYRSYEAGERRLSIADLVKLALSLHVPVERLVFGEQGRPKLLPVTALPKVEYNHTK